MLSQQSLPALMKPENISLNSNLTVSAGRSGSAGIIAPRDLLILCYLVVGRFISLGCLLPVIRPVIDRIVTTWLSSFPGGMQQLTSMLTLVLSESHSPEEIHRIALQIYLAAVGRAIDDLLLARNGKGTIPASIEILGEENLQNALDGCAGCILVSGHFFANKLAKRHLATLGFPVLSIMNHYPNHASRSLFRNRFLQPKMTDITIRAIGKRNLVFTDEGDLSLKILRRLKTNGLVDVHLDAGKSLSTQIRPFLGGFREFPTGFLKIAYLTRATLLPFSCIGDRNRLTITFGTAYDPPETGAVDENRFIADALSFLVSDLERTIRSRPDQWDGWFWWEPPRDGRP
jgi:lauroyl/myristoyl acyltransferase